MGRAMAPRARAPGWRPWLEVRLRLGSPTSWRGERGSDVTQRTCPQCGGDLTLAGQCPRCAAGGPLSATLAPVGGHAAESVLWKRSPSALLLIPSCIRRVLLLVLLGLIAYRRGALLSLLAEHLGGLRLPIAKYRQGLETMIPWICLAMALWVIYGLVVRYLLVKSRRYVLTDQRLMLEFGILSKAADDIDLRTVRETAFHQSALQRLFGIGTVHIMSGDQVAALAQFRMSGIPDPRSVRELVRSAAYAWSQRAMHVRET